MELQYYLILSALLFTIGVIGVLVRRKRHHHLYVY